MTIQFDLSNAFAIIKYIESNELLCNFVYMLLFALGLPLIIKLSWGYVKLIRYYIASLFGVNLKDEDNNIIVTAVSICITIISILILIPKPETACGY